MKKSDLWKTQDEHVIIQKSYKNLMKNLRTKLCKTCEKPTTTLQVSCENVKFAASDVIQETLCQRLLLVEYFKLKITDNQRDDFLRILSKNYNIFLRKSLTYKRLMKILRRT